MRLYLITHAHTYQDRTTEIDQWHLSEKGEKQAELLARQAFWGQVERLVLSSEPKTRLTVAQVIAQRKLPVIVDAHFDELRRPGWVDDYTASVKQAFAEPDLPSGAWEPATTALARFLVGIDDLCRRFPHETLALVGHGLTLSLYRAYLLDQTRVNLAEWQQLSFAALALVDPIARQIVQDFQSVAGQIARG